MKILYPLYLISFLNSDVKRQTGNENSVIKNEMMVSWSYNYDKICFELSAPTKGWLAIGFNKKSTLSGNYLLMGRVTNSGPQITEHFTISPGNYQSIKSLGGRELVTDVTGKDILGKSTIKFSIPFVKEDHYRKNLKKGQKYFMIMAFSRVDDFQHHSVMRTMVEVTL